MSKSVVLVDKEDKVIGFGDKLETHKIPVKLHRAISVLIFDKSRSKMLMTKRAKNKPTWGGYWSNAVCTHPYPNETYWVAAERRLFEELGIKTSLKEIFVFNYEAKMKNSNWGECELDHVFEGFYEGQIKPNPAEISDYKWIEMNKLKEDIENNLDSYTPWFRRIVSKLSI